MKTSYSIPLLVKASQGWFLKFNVDGKERREKLGLNRIKDLNEREKEFRHAAREIEKLLKAGTYAGQSAPHDLDNSFARTLTLSAALDFGMEKKKIKPKTRKDYECTVRFVKSAIKRLKYHNLMAVDTKKQHIKIILENIKEDRGWSAYSYNKNLGYLQGILKPLVRWFIIDSNPAHDQETYEEEQQEPRRTATPEQYAKIKSLLKRVHFNYYRFQLALFHSGIRPEEMTEVRLSQVDMDNREINLDWKNTKTNKARIVPMTIELYEFLCDMELEHHPKAFYLFGTFRPESMRYQKGYAEFLPAPFKVKRSRATRLWKKYVKDGLGIDVDQYAQKHSGANAMILEGISMAAIKRKFGHESMLTTEIYVTELKQTLLDEIKKSNIRFDNNS